MASAEDADITPFGMSCAGVRRRFCSGLAGMSLDHQFDKLDSDTQQGVTLQLEPSPEPMSSRSAHGAGAEDRRFTPSLWHLRMGATCEDAA